MFRRTFHPLIGIVLLLGAFGLAFTLFSEPVILLRRIIFIGLTIAIIYVLFRWISQRRFNKENAAYLRAVNQSKKLHVNRDRRPSAKALSYSKKGTHHRLPKKRTSSHLTVIEGKKGKKKNRALF
ncbi:hypothetical protein GFC29_1674 [Anoxybacillus sp. B7M1]|jgi:cytochrome b subunit of formate dehydrogenase|uniref:SA1362 family protein n=1 Tax=unclassified Anoxybacillus TaxID=2639704 RepID=UPI0005CD22A4|nr:MULTISPECIES: SA1362 family protein [unclassified Anoxybacillus]ANB58976.1 hypothetical protein GFC28_3759 [Anoxybacillus sp. B2M1]ANB63063.1 hypothetical protein GFC29_1674 [Anoxybacillus sp. B7M1]